MRVIVLLSVIVATLFVVGEPIVEAMGAPYPMAHSVAHERGFMCKGRAEFVSRTIEDGSTSGSLWRIADRTRPGTFVTLDPEAGLLEYLNRTDCEASVRLLNRRTGKTRYYCVPVRG